MAAVQNNPTITLPGVHNVLELYPDRVVIHRKSLYSRAFSSDRVLPFTAIVNVQLFECRFSDHGELRFTLAGAHQETVIFEFKCDQHHNAIAVKNSVEAALQTS
ncbi:MAG: hypothetical protein HXY41_09460 [Chloroflexi bacterium]|nr:hypothetical protein [Chloroflexota bacterium]